MGMCVGKYRYKCVDMCVDIRGDMRGGMRVEMCVDMPVLVGTVNQRLPAVRGTTFFVLSYD